MSSQERDLLTKLYANSQESVFILTPEEKKIQFANPRAIEDTSYELDELLGMSFSQLFLTDEQPAISTLLDATLQWNSGTDPHRALKRKSGKKITVEIVTMTIEFEGKKAISCSLRDITDRVKAEEKIREYSHELEKMNAELEQRVKDRTAVIQHQKKELDDVMQNIQEAIITLRSDLTINDGFSAYATEVFGTQAIAGVNALEFLFHSKESPEAQNLAAWVAQVFEQPEMWDIVRDFGPKELKYSRPESHADAGERDLKLEWRPIVENQKMTKMMLVCQDITEKKRLEAEISRREIEHNEELELISQLIEVSPDVIDQFVSDFENTLAEATRVIQRGMGVLGAEDGKALLRCLHTFKGAARQVGLKTLQSRAHELEDKVMLWFKDLEAGTAEESGYQKLKTDLEAIAAGTEKILEIYSKVTRGTQAQGSRGVPIPMSRIDALSDRLGPPFKNAEEIRRVLFWLLEASLGPMFERLADLAQQVAQSLGKKVQIEVVGEDLRFDQRIISLLSEGLQHVVRNAVDHGAETPDERVKAGKPEFVTLRLQAEASDGVASIVVRDDGKGIDVNRLREKAIAAGIVDPERAARAQPQEIAQYVFLPGLSTRDEVTETSGRGVGLDVLREAVEVGLGGKVRVKSQMGIGSTFKIEFRLDAFSPRVPESNRVFLSANSLQGIEALIQNPELEHAFAPHDLSHALQRRALQNGSLACPKGIRGFLERDAEIRAINMEDYSHKAEWIEQVTDYVHGLRGFPSMDQMAGSLAEELIMNGFFNGPTKSDGSPKYANRLRTEGLKLEKWETAVLRFGADASTFAISVEDPFGSLTRENLLKYLQKGLRQGKDQIDQKPGGAGLGLITLFNLSQWFGVVVESGRRTEMICVLPRTRSFEDYEKMGHSLSLFFRNDKGPE